MNKNLYPIILTGMFLIGMTIACNLPVAPSQQPNTETPIPTVRSTETATPVNTVVPASETPTLVPFCEPDVASISTPESQCKLPIAEAGDSFCTKKVPYNLIFMNEGSTYQALSEIVTCSEASIQDGRQVITCTGPMATSFELRVCDPSCAVPTLQTASAQCPQGYIFNAPQACCMPEAQLLQPNCVTLKLKTKTCVVNCSVYTKKSECKENSFACIWNEKTGECQLRR